MAFDLDTSLGFLVNRAAASMRLAFEQKLAPHGLTAPQWAVLARLLGQDGLPIGVIGASLGYDAPTMTGIARRLEAKRLVKRVRGSAGQDQRTVILQLTPVGRRLMERLPALAEEVNRRATRGLSVAERDELKRLLPLVTANLNLSE